MVRSLTKRQTGGGHTAAAPLVPRHATPPSLRPPLIQRGALAPGFAFTFTCADGCTGEPACWTARPTCNAYVSRTSVPAIAPLSAAPLPGVHVSETAPRPSLTARDGDTRPPFAVKLSFAFGTRLP